MSNRHERKRLRQEGGYTDGFDPLDLEVEKRRRLDESHSSQDPPWCSIASVKQGYLPERLSREIDSFVR